MYFYVPVMRIGLIQRIPNVRKISSYPFHRNRPRWYSAPPCQAQPGGLLDWLLHPANATASLSTPSLLSGFLMDWEIYHHYEVEMPIKEPQPMPSMCGSHTREQPKAEEPAGLCHLPTSSVRAGTSSTPFSGAQLHETVHNYSGIARHIYFFDLPYAHIRTM